MVEQTIRCDKCKAKIHRAVSVNNSEYCGPCSLAVVSELIRRGHVVIVTSKQNGRVR